MDVNGIKSGGIGPTHDVGTLPQVNRVAMRQESLEEDASAPAGESGFVPSDTSNLVSANGRVYDLAAPRGTYLNILV